MTTDDRRLVCLIYFALSDEPWVPADQELLGHLADVVYSAVAQLRLQLRTERAIREHRASWWSVLTAANKAEELPDRQAQETRAAAEEEFIRSRWWHPSFGELPPGSRRGRMVGRRRA